MIEKADHDGIAILTLNHRPVNALDLELLAAGVPFPTVPLEMMRHAPFVVD